MMNAEFLGVVQLIIYVGAISILIVFAILMTQDVVQGNLPNRLQIPAVLLPALLLAALAFVAFQTDWNLISDNQEGTAACGTGAGQYNRRRDRRGR